MQRTLAEQKVLKKLGIPDFRHMTKDKVVKFASLLPKMDPQVAMKALEQFPEFVGSAKEMLSYYKETIDKALDSNNESVKSNYEICNTILLSLKDQLEDEALTFEQKMIVEEKMIDVAKLAAEIDKENKNFIIKAICIGGTAVLGTLAIAASVLGSKSEISSDDDGSDDVIDVDYTDV